MHSPLEVTPVLLVIKVYERVAVEFPFVSFYDDAMLFVFHVSFSTILLLV